MRKLTTAFTALFVAMIAVSQPLRIATYQYADNDRIACVSPLATRLSAALGSHADVKSYPTVHAFIEAIRNDEVDVALINTFGYLLLQASGKPYPMQPLLTLEINEKAKDNYKTAFLVHPSLPVKDLMDIKGSAEKMRLALVAKGSTSGNMLPRLALSYAGITDAEKTFAAVQYAGTHAKAIDAILSHEADLATMGFTEYQRYLSRDSSNALKLKLIWTSPEIPLGPVLFNKRIGKDQLRILTKAFLDLHQTDPEALAAVKAGWSEAKQAEKYIAITDAFYDPFRKVLGNPGDLERILKQFAE